MSNILKIVSIITSVVEIILLAYGGSCDSVITTDEVTMIEDYDCPQVVEDCLNTVFNTCN